MLIYKLSGLTIIVIVLVIIIILILILLLMLLLVHVIRELILLLMSIHKAFISKLIRKILIAIA